ncbi:MAG: ATP-binding protein [Syntrophobacteraceae bacterium]
MNEEAERLSRLTAELEEARRRIEELEGEQSRHRELEREYARQNAFLLHVIESLPHPFYVLDAKDYSIKIANSAAHFGSGHGGHATCYALTHQRSTPCEHPEHSCPLMMVKESKQPVTVEHVHFDPEGNPRNVEVHGYPIFDENGQVVQMIEYALDITERKQMERQIVENAERIKRFAYSVSHDLKSPIIGIYGLTRLLHRHYRDTMDERGRMYCDQILRASELAVDLVEEINAYIRAKENPLSFEPIQTEEVLHTVRDEFGAFLSMRQIAWEEPGSLPQIKADRMSLIRAFRNLVDNALKYGGESLSRIEIGYEERDGAHVFSVSDNGVGIPACDRERIFELFQRNPSAKGVEGTGLGLAIVKEIAEKHQGQVWVESDPGTRTTFYLAIGKAL